VTFDELRNSLARPAQRALANAGISSYEDLARLTEHEIAQLHGIGKNALTRITAALEVTGMRLHMDDK
jgi:DNA-directed RNA polymerase alpha subunit